MAISTSTISVTTELVTARQCTLLNTMMSRIGMADGLRYEPEADS